MTVRIDDNFVAGNELYPTKLHAYPDGDYSLHQVVDPFGDFESDKDMVGDVYLNKQQAIKYAKAILRNEGIHAID